MRPAEVFASLGPHRVPVGGTFTAVAALAADPSFRNLVRSRYGLSSANAVEFLYELSALAVRLYIGRPALTTLHAVTGAQALIELVPYLGADDQAALVGIFSIWLCALYAEKGSPDISFAAGSLPPPTGKSYPRAPRNASIRILSSSSSPSRGSTQLGSTRQIFTPQTRSSPATSHGDRSVTV